jgi:hypothetical protein
MGTKSPSFTSHTELLLETTIICPLSSLKSKRANAPSEAKAPFQHPHTALIA